MENKNNLLKSAIYDQFQLNNVFIDLYTKLLKCYSSKLLHSETQMLDENEIKKLLRFADLLSYSPYGWQKTIAQQIVVLLEFIYKDSVLNDVIKRYERSVLSNCTNYIGLNCLDINYSPDVLSFMDQESTKSIFKIGFEKDDYFFENQKEIFDSFDKYQAVSFSAPTSLGKTFIIEMFIKSKMIENFKGNFALVVPTKALINEIEKDLIEVKLNNLLHEKKYRVVTSPNDLFVEKDQDSHFIFVFTPERLLYLLSSFDKSIDYLFIDEAYKMSEHDSRSLYYSESIKMFQKKNPESKIVFSSPNLENPGIFLKNLNVANKSEKRVNYSPVNQIKYLVETKKENSIRVYNEITNELDFVKRLEPKFDSLDFIFNQSKDKCSLVYCNGLEKTIEKADVFFEKFKEKLEDVPELVKLSKEIQEQIHEDYYLAKFIKKGIAYHVGYLPNSLREKIEQAFKKKLIKIMFCTSTLMEGVNFPADNLFIFTSKRNTENMDSLSFKNLIGRIGRINYSLYGNVFLFNLNKNVSSSTYKELLDSSPKVEKLALDEILDEKNKDSIINPILEKTFKFEKKDKIDAETYKSVANIYLNELKSNHESEISKRINAGLSKDQLLELKEYVSSQELSDNMEISPNQFFNLRNAIDDNENPLVYPIPHKNKDNSRMTVEYDELGNLLVRMSQLFDWDFYEHGDLNSNSLRLTTRLLYEWISSKNIKTIIQGRIDYLSKNHLPIYVTRHPPLYEHYDDSLKHKNVVIRDVLNFIENTILFKLANYFRFVSKQMKEKQGVKYLDNDWYEYIEYGTIDPLMIQLQRIGYKRDSARFIVDASKKGSNHPFLLSGKTSLTSFKLDLQALKHCGDEETRERTDVVLINVPEVFIK